MIVHSVTVEQDSHAGRRGRFLKELVRLERPVALAMVRKRLVGRDGRAAPTIGAVLLVHGFGQNRYSWHLSSRSLSAHLALAGFDVFSLDLRGHGRSRDFGSAPASTVDLYIQHDLPAVIAAVRALSKHSSVFYVGHSMGAVLGQAAALSLGPQMAGMVSLAPPYRFGEGGALLRGMVGALMRLTAPLPARTELPMRLVRGIFNRPREVWDHPSLPIPLRMWAPRAMEPEVLREYVQRSFDRATFGELAQIAHYGIHGRFESADGRVDYADSWRRAELPVLVIAGAHDLLAPPASVHPAFAESGSRDKTYRNLPFGHGDLILGRDAPELMWSALTAWLTERAK